MEHGGSFLTKLWSCEMWESQQCPGTGGHSHSSGQSESGNPLPQTKTVGISAQVNTGGCYCLHKAFRVFQSLCSVLPPQLICCSKPSPAQPFSPILPWAAEFAPCEHQALNLSELQTSEHHSNSLREGGWICLNTPNSFFLQFQSSVCSADPLTHFLTV